MISASEIDHWAGEVARSEAASIRDAVREAMVGGASAAAALAAVRRRLSRLTPAQRELVVAAIGRPA